MGRPRRTHLYHRYDMITGNYQCSMDITSITQAGLLLDSIDHWADKKHIYKSFWSREKRSNYFKSKIEKNINIINSEPDKIKQSLNYDFDIKSELLKKPQSLTNLVKKHNTIPEIVLSKIDLLKKENYNVIEKDNIYYIDKTLKEGGISTLNMSMWKGDKLKIGFTSDNHLCSHHERLDVLNLLYDIFEGEGISTVFNAGNWIDGEARFNKNEIHTKGLTKQIEYAVREYPYRKGIKTKFIAGDDHEGWYTIREGVNIGEYFQMKRELAGLSDLEYLGYMEADIELTEGGFDNNSWLRIAHPGGGSAYATSYTSQKIVESYQGGEKPAVLLLGHFHKLDYAYPREVHVVQTGCTMDQSTFMRKKRIAAHLGGGIIELNRAKDGTINRCKVEFITAFDKKFYIGKDKYLR